MILYNAGSAPTYAAEAEMRTQGCRRRLLTFAEIDSFSKGSFKVWVEEAQADQDQRVFVDSGAFGAFSRGVVIDLSRYCDYLSAHKDRITAYAALDVIRDWKATAANLAAMHAMGLDPIPTFHRGSPWDVLSGLARDHHYIALGGVVSDRAAGVEGMRTWLDECMRRLQPHWPIKVHAFGITAQWAMERYPFYSVDSSSAIFGAGAMGRVLQWRNGRTYQPKWHEVFPVTLDGSIADDIDRPGPAGSGRRRASIAAARALERYVTDLWSGKGVRWDT